MVGAGETQLRTLEVFDQGFAYNAHQVVLVVGIDDIQPADIKTLGKLTHDLQTKCMERAHLHRFS
ncbi:hypothetical protein SDC9_170249 [bioreactor metagenome]|uniref:Uncharacterized protein n=1 Tax=bioreactor metagenome TaxID=1076179 RepID=A0A645GG58_9ZZZZ